MPGDPGVSSAPTRALQHFVRGDTVGGDARFPPRTEWSWRRGVLLDCPAIGKRVGE